MQFFPLPKFLTEQMILFQDSKCLYKKYVFPLVFGVFLIKSDNPIFAGLEIPHTTEQEEYKRDKKYLQLPQIGREKAIATAWKQHLYNCINWESSRQMDGLTAGWERANLSLTRKENSTGKQSRRTPQGLMTVFFFLKIFLHTCSFVFHHTFQTDFKNG